MRIAFYAPLKAPSHPVPSGDRRMAKLLISALEQAGHRVGVASDFRSFEGAGDQAEQAALAKAGEAEAERLIAFYGDQAAGNRPEIWFTYHLYYKAPDHLGPAVATALGIPYVVAEASHAPKRAEGAWRDGHAAVVVALERADAVLCLTKLDISCVENILKSPERLVYLPPFLDPTPYTQAGRGERSNLADRLGLDANKAWLVAVGMMRPGDKLESYRRLAAALARLDGDDWQLIAVGDGEARGETETAMAPLGPERVIFPGELPPDELAAALPAFDICVWPAAGEAYGMALLEAQAAGLPVVAGHVRGVPEVVRDGISAVLVPEKDADAFAGAVRAMLDDPERRQTMAENAVQFVRRERSLASAAAILDEALVNAALGYGANA